MIRRIRFRSSQASNATLDGCVGNLTRKILGDDTREIMDLFEDFLGRKAPGKVRGRASLSRCSLQPMATAGPVMCCVEREKTTINGNARAARKSGPAAVAAAAPLTPLLLGRRVGGILTCSASRAATATRAVVAVP